jgi:hypothetical protein
LVAMAIHRLRDVVRRPAAVLRIAFIPDAHVLASRR